MNFHYITNADLRTKVESKMINEIYELQTFNHKITSPWCMNFIFTLQILRKIGPVGLEMMSTYEAHQLIAIGHLSDADVLKNQEIKHFHYRCPWGQPTLLISTKFLICLTPCSKVMKYFEAIMPFHTMTTD